MLCPSHAQEVYIDNSKLEDKLKDSGLSSRQFRITANSKAKARQLQDRQAFLNRLFAAAI